MIRVKLFATLREGRDKEIVLPYQQGITGKDVLKILNIPEDQVAIFLVNGKDRNLEEPLSDGDILAIFPPVGGG